MVFDVGHHGDGVRRGGDLRSLATTRAFCRRRDANPYVGTGDQRMPVLKHTCARTAGRFTAAGNGINRTYRVTGPEDRAHR